MVIIRVRGKDKKIKKKKVKVRRLTPQQLSDMLAMQLIKAPKKRVNLLTDVKIPPRKWDIIKGRLR